ncbi:phage tail protein [Enterobacter cloacae complex sp. CDL008]|uniref:phage tail-collar fiber domain-containing protein n=1 Tax=unclassified Enterobacter cloacae complex TaxID=2757714 RepID=UPI003BA67433
MSQTAITLVFEQWKAQQAATGEPVLLDEFVFAMVPGLDPALPVDRSEALPPAAQIVYRAPVARKGVVNENSVVHSAVLGADVGDFSFNWIGLMNKASGTLAMIVHAPEQQKLKTKDGQQGNVLTRSFLMEFTGAQTETAINTPAETWQIDFTARMAGMDERQRLENIDIYGTAAFFGNGWLVGKSGNQYFVSKGAGYVAGLRAGLAANQNITVTTKPVKVWLDVCWTGALTSVWAVQSKVTVAANLADYVQNGVQHYVFALASIDANGNITDLRPKGSLDGQAASDALKAHEKSRNHPDATTGAKGFVQLSSATNSDSETLAATPKAVKAANDNASARVARSGDNMTGPLKIRSADALRIYDAAYGMIFRRSETNFYLIPTAKDQGENGGISGLRPLYIDLTNGRVTLGNGAVVNGGLGLGVVSGLGGNSIALGDNDTGFKQNGDGVLDVYANSRQVMRFLSGGITSNVLLNMSAGSSVSGALTFKNGGSIVSEKTGANPRNGRIYWGGDASRGNRVEFADDAGWKAYIERHPTNGVQLSVNGRIIGSFIYSSGEVQAGGGKARLAADGNIYGSKWGNQWLDAYLRNTYQPKGNYTPAGQAYTKGESDGRYYTKAQSDGGYQKKGNYVTAVRFGASAEYQERGNTERMKGGVMTSWADRGSSNYWVRVRPLQYQINGGSWVTAAYA